ncbi:LLM class flavin-dependent oxidoreductase [Jatrophihabitans sp.]|uniref:LLM class flavin-dependent oxidoreductase n=1 Tax=Jatrophihabitans sp. TaxID=1932789 RepID=UPI002F0B6D60
MKLGLNLGYWGMGNDADNLALAREADVLGYSCVWAAEAYGSDAPTVLAWIGAQTERIELGSAILQIPARSPAMAAMTAATLDTLSGGRFRLGLGVSGPQVSEGWHGVRFSQPLARTREYVDIVNLALSRRRVRYEGTHYTLPLPDGPGKALQLTVHPVRERIPVYLASVGPKNLELTGEIADGWLSIFFSTDFAAEQLARIAAGRAKVGKDLDGFDVVASAPLVVSPNGSAAPNGTAGSAGDDPDDPGDLDALAAPLRNYAALYIGGMGSRDVNFYNQLAVRMGYQDEAAEIQRRYLARDYDGAAAAVPLEFIDSTALLGSPDRIARRMAEFAAAGVTTLNVMPYAATLEDRLTSLRIAAEALRASGAAT